MSWTIQAQMTFKSSNTATTSLVVGDKSVYSANSTQVNILPSGFTTPVTGAGTRLMWLPTMGAFRVGTVSGTNWNSSFIGINSFATGVDTYATGSTSTAMGLSTQAIGYASTALGFYTESIGDFATATGFFSVANGNKSFAMGNNTTAQSYGSLSIGQYNIISGNSTSWTATDPVFIIGNGELQNPSNAFTVLKNGRTAIGFEAPESMLHIKKGDAGAITYYPESNLNVESNANNYISLLSPNNRESGILFGNPSSNVDGGIIYNNSTNKNLQFRTNGNITRMTLSNAGNLTVTGTVTASCGLLVCSDARYKKNISSLDNSLDNILKVKGLRYDLRQAEFPEKNFSEKNQIGFIAQDLEKIFPEMVFTDEKGYKSVDYGRLTPVLVEAVKELSSRNEALKIKSEKVEARLEKLEALLLKTEVVKNR